MKSRVKKVRKNGTIYAPANQLDQINKAIRSAQVKLGVEEEHSASSTEASEISGGEEDINPAFAPVSMKPRFVKSSNVQTLEGETTEDLKTMMKSLGEDIVPSDEEEREMGQDVSVASDDSLGINSDIDYDEWDEDRPLSEGSIKKQPENTDNKKVKKQDRKRNRKPAKRPNGKKVGRNQNLPKKPTRTPMPNKKKESGKSFAHKRQTKK